MKIYMLYYSSIVTRSKPWEYKQYDDFKTVQSDKCKLDLKNKIKLVDDFSLEEWVQ